MAMLSILTVKFVAIGLSKELAGNYNSAYGFLQVFGILADFGLYAVAVREVSKTDRREAVLGALIVLRSIILLISLCSALALIWLIPAWQGTPLPLGATIAALVPFFTLLAGMLRTVFQVHYKLQYVFIAEVTQRIVTVSTIGLAIWLGVRGSTDLHVYHLFLFCGGVGAFVLFFLSLSAANRLMSIKLNFDRELITELFKKAAPFGVAFFCLALYRQIDITLIALLRDDFELQNAYYGFVMRMVEMGYLIPTFLLNSTLPVLAEREQKGQETGVLLGKTLFILVLIGLLGLVFSLLWARPLVELLTTEAYLSTANRAGSDTALRLMSVPLLLNGIILFSFYVLLTKNRWQALVPRLLFGAVVSVILNLVLIPQHGFVGAGITSIVVHCLLAVALLPPAWQAMRPTLKTTYIGQGALFIAIITAALYASAPYLAGPIHTAIGLGAMAIIIALAASGSGILKSLTQR